ncbi:MULTISPECIES: hypothetical protein [Kitasatospora]|nr:MULTISPECIES: hypothetical protein [Kitasatospora]
MPLCDYFSAADDSAALAVLDAPGGPAEGGLDTLPLKDVDPVVVLARLEAVLTGCRYEEARARPRAGLLLSEPEAEEAFVVAVSDTLAAALAALPAAELPGRAAAWSGSGDLQDVTPAEAAAALDALSGLARRARAAHHRLYCWWAL